MEKDEHSYSGNFLGVEFNSNHDHVHGHGHDLDLPQQQQQQQQEQCMTTKPRITGEIACENGNQMVDYLLNNPSQPGGFCRSNSFDRLSFADVMQFADLGPKLALNRDETSHEDEEETGIDPIYFLKFPVLNDRSQEDVSLMAPHHVGGDGNGGVGDEDVRVSEDMSVQLQFADDEARKLGLLGDQGKKRKRPRTMKTSEEVESQRMTHIAVERNRRKQMNEHLRVLRSLMPGSYVQRGDQASIIGGAIEFVRELEQLLQCLESQKRRRLYGDTQRAVADTPLPIQPPQQALFLPPLPLPSDDPIKLVDYDAGLMREETAESKSCLADVEVRLAGFDAMIKILCRRRPGQLIKTIAALEDLRLNILHTNITTIEQTVLYSFNVKVVSEARFSAEDIANSVQQIIGFIHANT